MQGVAQEVSLSELQKGQRGRVIGLNAEDPVNQRLMIMGLLPDMELALVKVAPLGDPIAIEFEGQTVSLRRAEAAYVRLEPLPAK